MKLMTDAAPQPVLPPPNTNLPELSVSELAQAVKRAVETNFDRVRVRGELGPGHDRQVRSHVCGPEGRQRLASIR